MKDDPKNVEDIVQLHNETQEAWECRVKEFSKQLNSQEQDMKDIKEYVGAIKRKMKAIKDQIALIDPGYCVRDDSFKDMSEKYKQMCAKYDEGQKDLTQILVNQASILERINHKKEKDQIRNGKVDKLGEKEDETIVRVVKLETKMEDMSDSLSTIISLLKALGVGFVIFFITFIVKTFLWGY